jgi:hypothetical protein
MTSNPVEELLNDSGSLSFRQIHQRLGLPLKTVKYHIYTSDHIEDTPPYVHGSGKTKINCVRYSSISKKYFDRRVKVRNLLPFEESVQNVSPVQVAV